METQHVARSGPEHLAGGARQAGPVAPGYLDRRASDRRPRHLWQERRGEGLRPPGQGLYRCRGGALVRQYRLRADQACRGRGRGNVAHRLLPHLRRRLQRAPDQARREAALAAPRARGLPPYRQGVLRALRLGRERHAVQAGPLLQQPARPAREEEDHLAPRRLSRRHRRGWQPHGHSALPQGLRPAHRGRAAHRLPALLARRP